MTVAITTGGSEVPRPNWKLEQTHEKVPNPVIATCTTSDGGTARMYRDGMVDAVDGSFYSLSLGFDSYEELETWISTTVANKGEVS